MKTATLALLLLAICASPSRAEDALPSLWTFRCDAADADPKVRSRVAAELMKSTVPEPDRAPLLLALLDDADADVRISVVRALNDCAPAIWLAALRSKYPDVVRETCWSRTACWPEDPEIIAEIGERFRKRDYLASGPMHKLGKAAALELEKAWASTNPDVREDAVCQAQHSMKDSEITFSIVVEALDDESPEIRAIAAVELGAADTDFSIRILLKALATGARDRRLSIIAGLADGRSHYEGSLSAILDIVETDPAEDAAREAEALVQFGNQGVTALVRDFGNLPDKTMAALIPILVNTAIGGRQGAYGRLEGVALLQGMPSRWRPEIAEKLRACLEGSSDLVRGEIESMLKALKAK